MNSVRRIVGRPESSARFLGAADVLILVVLVSLLYAGIRLASPNPVLGPEIDLSPSALPWYALLSLGRMAASYVLSIAFSLVYGYFAGHNRSAERIMMPILDVLQSVPLLSFLPVVLLILTTILPQRLGIEASAVILIFTGQAWNIAYSFYQSVRTAPTELQEASSIFRMNWWYRLRYVELPFGTLGLLWNSVVSWANGWFFLMAAETFRVGDRDFRLPGLGSYVQAAADAGDTRSIFFGFVTLVLLVVMLDQLVWRPLLAWADKFRIDLVENDNPPTSWFLELMQRSRLASAFMGHVINPIVRSLDRRYGARLKPEDRTLQKKGITWQRALRTLILLIFAGAVIYQAVQAVQLLATLPIETWGRILVSTLASGARVFAAMFIGLLWTVPVGVAIGTNPRLAAILTPIVQILAAIPATALFPILVLFMVKLPLGLDGAAILLMLLGTQWYLLFNIIAGASVISQDLRDAVSMFGIKGWARWKTLILPAIFTYIITGLNIAGGGAWNASIIAEYTEYNKQVYTVPGLGSMISEATATGNYALLLAATLTMIITVIAVNQFVWLRLHHLAQQKFRVDG
jgi:NitT/TauT family transport system permease protein